MVYPVQTPWWLKRLYRHCLWEMPGDGNKVYLSFDDGPHPEATVFVLDLLKEYQAKASFFCIGKNVESNPELYHRILAEGHRAGNHTYSHANGWRTATADYLSDISKARAFIDSSIFRPPYGRITFSQLKKIRGDQQMKPVMWSLLSGDFDPGISPEKCARNVLDHMKPGSIIVFHDSQKAFERLRYALPLVLRVIRERGWVTELL